MTMPPAPPPNDEVSLRELYLVVRRHVWAIVVFAAAVALLVFAVVALRPASYEAEATTAVARAPISVQQESGLAFRPELDVSFDTYQTLAFSRGVFERVLAAVPAAELSSSEIRDAVSLERLAGAANQPTALLAVAHRARHGDPQVAADLATAWATVTIDTVRTLLNDNLDAIERITIDGVASASRAVEAAEQDLRDLRESQDGVSDQRRLTSLQARLNDLDVRADEIARSLRSREAEAASLATRVAEGGDEFVVLSDSPEVALTVAGSLWATEARLAALRAELEIVEAQRERLRAEIAALSTSVVRYQSDLDRLARRAEQAQRGYTTLANIEPTVAYVAQLAPTGARVLAEAAVPNRPASRNVIGTTVLAGVVAGFAALVIVLLREAVRDPVEPRAAPRRGALARHERDA
jgi:uncharacterized protein involved in exopolysaccharide biosynthesis